MIIAGITGGIGHGKTTFADLLAARSNAARHFESWEVVAEVATLLKDAPSLPSADNIDGINDWLVTLPDILKLQVHVDVMFSELKLTDERIAAHPEHYEKLFEFLNRAANDSSLHGDDITVENKEAFRPLLQWLGGYLVVCCGSGIWYDEIMRRVNRLRNSNVDLVTIGGVRFPGDAERVRNAGGYILQISRPDLHDQDSQDLTERERTNIQPDAVIINNGSLRELEQLANQVLEDLRVHQLKPEYRSIEQSANA